MLIDSDGGLRLETHDGSDQYHLVEGLPPLKNVIKLNSGFVVVTQVGSLIFIKTRSIHHIYYNDLDIDNLITSQLTTVNQVTKIVNQDCDRFIILFNNDQLYQAEIINRAIVISTLIDSNVYNISDNLVTTNDNCVYNLSHPTIDLAQTITQPILSCRDNILITGDYAYVHCYSSIRVITFIGSNIIDTIKTDIDHHIYVMIDDGSIHLYNLYTESSTMIEHGLFKYVRAKRFISMMNKSIIIFEDIEGDLYSLHSEGKIGSINLDFKLLR